MMANHGIIDWRGNPVSKEKHGGVRASCFIYFMVVTTNIAYVANMLNLVTYFNGTMHMDIASSSTTVTNFIGGTSAFSLLGAFLSDSYITRFNTILIFGPFEVLGFGLLALQAHLPSLQPPVCNTTEQWSGCEKVHGFNSTLLFIALYTIALGEGCLRACLASLGGDQFDDDDPNEARLKSSFFNWFTFGISVGVFTGLILVVWIENNKGWDFGFAVSALVVLIGLIVLASGFPFYRNQKPRGSPITRMMQVFVAAFRKRKLNVSENLHKLKQIDAKDDDDDVEVLPHTKGLSFLDKAAIDEGDTRAWWLCTVTQVEETKIILRMVPIFISSMLGYIASPLIMTFTIQQGGTMNTSLGKIHIAPASLFIIPVTFQMASLVVYDRIFVPFARRITGYTSGITHLQRIALGLIATLVAPAIAAVVERRRKRVVGEEGMSMSVFWLGAQFFMLGISDVTSFVGLLEFFNSEVSRGMKSMATAIFWCTIGLASLMSTFMVGAVNRATRGGGDGGMGWLAGSDLNKSHLDRFYWLLSGFGLVAFGNYLFWARRYVYRHSPLAKNVDESDGPLPRHVF